MFDASASNLEEVYASAMPVVRSLLPMLAAPHRGLPSEVADEVFVLPEGTKFKSKLTPYMIEPMNTVVSRNHVAVAFCSAARTGKTISLVDAIQAYIIAVAPSDNLTIFATEAMARRYARMRFDRMVKNSPDLKCKLSTDHNKDNVLNKMFNHGMASWFGSPSPTNLSASEYKFCFWSDVDRGDDNNSDGDIYAQLKKRTTTYLSAGMTIAEASPSRDILDPNYKPSSPHEAPPVSGILGLYNDGDRRMWYWRCPHCSEQFKLSCDLELFQLPNQKELLFEVSESSVKSVANKYAHIYCPECGARIEEHHKTELNLSGEWKKEIEDDDNEVASFWLSGVAAKFQNWHSILTNYLKALAFYEDTGDEKKLKAMFNVDLGQPYMPKNVSDVIGAKDLEDRAIDMGKLLVPIDGRYLIATVDVQKRKFVVQIECWGTHETRWLIDRFDITLSNRVYGGVKQGLEPATYLEDWDLLLSDVMTKRYALTGDTDRTMGILLTVCDSGGTYSTISDSSVTENAYKFWRKCKKMNIHKQLALIKGTRGTPASNAPAIKLSVLGKQSSAARSANVVDKLPLWLLNTTFLKDTLMARLKKKGKKGVIHFPEWLPSWFYKEVTSEVRTDKGWENLKGRRNEAFDLLGYAHAGNLILLDSYWSGSINWDQPPPWADVWDNNPHVTMADKFKENVKKRKGRVVRSATRPTNGSGFRD